MKKGFQFYIKLYYKMATENDIKNAVLSVFPDTEYVVVFSNQGGGVHVLYTQKTILNV